MKFQAFQDRTGEWRWHLFAANGTIIADSGEGYKRKGQCLKAIDRIRDGAASATVEVDPTRRAPRAQLQETDKL